MLVLARKIDESIVIGENIVIKVVSVDNGVVKLGIEAPKEVSIFRNELLEQVKETNKAAMQKISDEEINSLSELLGKKK
ncbi:carbon storage regulator CsrA [Sulfurimonas sp.]